MSNVAQNFYPLSDHFHAKLRQTNLNVQKSKWLMNGSPKVLTGFYNVYNEEHNKDSWYPLNPYGLWR